MFNFFIIFIINLYNKIVNYSYFIYSRLFLRNNIDQEIIDIIEDGKKKFNKKNLIIDDVNSVKFYKKSNDLKYFIIEVFLIDINKNKNNIKENLFLLKGYKINNIINVISFDLKNSDDLGELVPENSNNYHF